jgi:DNA replication protein DnaC
MSADTVTPEQLQAARVRAGLSPREHGFRVEQLEPRLVEASKPDALADALLQADGEAPWLVLTGPVGSGKTHLAIALLNHWMDTRHLMGRFVSVANLLLRVRSTYQSNAVETELAVVQEFGQTPLLVLDDLGAGYKTESQHAESVLLGILDERYRWERRLIVTTNLSESRLEQVLEPRTMSRLRGRARFVACGTADLRYLEGRGTLTHKSGA